MVIYRCTRKFIKKGLPIFDSNIESDTTLGDWYVDYIQRRPFHIILFTNEKSVLPLLLPAVPLRTLFERFTKQLYQNLIKIGIKERYVIEEINKMKEYSILKTINRRVLGTMNEFKYDIEWFEYDKTPETLDRLTWHVAETPCSAIKQIFPIEAVKDLFNKKYCCPTMR